MIGVSHDSHHVANYQVDVEVVDDVEGNHNRGWRVDKVSVKHDGDEIGYLKMAYIDKERFDDYYPSIFNWLDQIKGQIIIPRPADNTNASWDDARKRHYRDFSTEELRKFIGSLRQYAANRVSDEDLTACDHDMLQALATVAEVEATQRFGREFKKFKTYYCMKPIDDFVRVERDYQRNGIAEMMYRVAVKYLDERGMHLYLSTIRQAEAEALAEKFRTAGVIRKMSNGRERFIAEKITL